MPATIDSLADEIIGLFCKNHKRIEYGHTIRTNVRKLCSLTINSSILETNEALNNIRNEIKYGTTKSNRSELNRKLEEMLDKINEKLSREREAKREARREARYMQFVLDLIERQSSNQPRQPQVKLNLQAIDITQVLREEHISETDEKDSLQDYRCPITQKLIAGEACKVKKANGNFQYFDKVELIKWVKLKGTNPLTRHPLAEKDILDAPEYKLETLKKIKNIIEQHQKDTAQIKEDLHAIVKKINWDTSLIDNLFASSAASDTKTAAPADSKLTATAATATAAAPSQTSSPASSSAAPAMTAETQRVIASLQPLLSDKAQLKQGFFLKFQKIEPKTFTAVVTYLRKQGHYVLMDLNSEREFLFYQPPSDEELHAFKHDFFENVQYTTFDEKLAVVASASRKDLYYHSFVDWGSKSDIRIALDQAFNQNPPDIKAIENEIKKLTPAELLAECTMFKAAMYCPVLNLQLLEYLHQTNRLPNSLEFFQKVLLAASEENVSRIIEWVFRVKPECVNEFVLVKSLLLMSIRNEQDSVFGRASALGCYESGVPFETAANLLKAKLFAIQNQSASKATNAAAINIVGCAAAPDTLTAAAPASGVAAFSAQSTTPAAPKPTAAPRPF